tara:strand:- start:1045 stop:2067 length:1023 start_codon:yes stop_codon:yes gene_type:complete
MSAYKQLNRQDVYTSDYVAKKTWFATGSLLNSYGIETLRGFKDSTPGYPYPTDYLNNRYQKLVYDSAYHNYLGNTYGTKGMYSGSRDVSLSTTLTLSGSREANSEVGIISLPKDIVGVGIEPGTVVIQPERTSADYYNTVGYVGSSATGFNDYTEQVGEWYGTSVDTADYVTELDSNYVIEAPEEYVTSGGSFYRPEIFDDGEGRLILSGSYTSKYVNEKVVGDVIYNQGIIIITDPIVARYYSTYSRHKIDWKSKQPIYTYNVHCTVRESEMNHSYNPSAISGTDNTVKSNITGSYFRPYVTTVGLYNEANELLAVAKTNRPIPKSQNIDMTFVVKIDL